MAEFAFWIVCGSLTLNIATTTWSILRPHDRIWPPPGDTSWQYTYSLALSLVWMVAFLEEGHDVIDAPIQLGNVSWPQSSLGVLHAEGGVAFASLAALPFERGVDLARGQAQHGSGGAPHGLEIARRRLGRVGDEHLGG